jgi:serine/threonine protein kinase
VGLAPGTRFGRYKIVTPIGAGGMGEVYRARDPRLDRDVALKLLPDAFACDPDRVALLEREARLLAALNHPHVGAIYGIEDSPKPGDGGAGLALVLELVEGETLLELIDRHGAAGSTLPLKQILAIARQIAAALDAAHEKSIVHRDLKPANVKITPSGTVKVLDFGLGHMMAPSASSAASETTIRTGTTLPGTLLGTPAYMSPEQARGESVDRRTDIWAFGCVLFEMLSGARAFGGNTIPDTIARVIERHPDWSRLPPRLPPSLDRLLRRVLEKDPHRRLRDIGDACLELDDAEVAAESPETIQGHLGEITTNDRNRDVSLERLTDSVGLVESPAISPDGKMVAFVAATAGRRQIWIRMLAGGAPLQITRDPTDHTDPRWLPDSSELVYYSAGAKGDASGHIYQLSALGGPPRRLVAALGGADVSHEGQRMALFRQTGDDVSLVVRAFDGASEVVVASLSPDGHYARPRWSPDDRLISIEKTAEPTLFNTSIDVVTVADRELRTLTRSRWIRGHSWLPDGSGIVYSTSTGSTMAYPPTNNLRVISCDGAASRQLTFGDVSYLEPDVHASGRLLANRVRSRSDVWKFATGGSPTENTENAVRITRQAGQVQAPSIGPDGRDLVYISDSGGHSNLWLIGADGTSPRQVTFERDPRITVAVPMWAPAGGQLLFVRATDEQPDLCLVQADGGGFSTLLSHAWAPSWSHDGRFVYCCRSMGFIDRLEVATGTLQRVRSDRSSSPMAVPGSETLCFTRLSDQPGDGTEICRATPDDGPAEVLARVPSARIPMYPRIQLSINIAPDGRSLAAPMIDSTTANIWLIPSDGSPMRPVTDFGERSVFIARWVSWSADSRHIYAAVGEVDADIVLLEGLLR